MQKILTWKDIERVFYSSKKRWNKIIASVDVFPNYIYVYLLKGKKDKDAMKIIKELFPRNYGGKDYDNIYLDLDKRTVSVIFDENDENTDKPDIPLFKDIIYRDSSYTSLDMHSLACPVIAFHSYKGGVGRTLSLLAFAKAWTESFENDSDRKRLLIVDADIEAPGLTWISGIDGEPSLSYLDILDIIQDNCDKKKIVNILKSKGVSEQIVIEGTKQNVEHIFIPTYRYTEQLLDQYANPETVVNAKDKMYIIADILSDLAKELGASAVVIDLRAGLSEMSAPYLFDKRIKKYIVTSTSSQSIYGTRLLLKYLFKGLSIDAETVLPEIFISMIPDIIRNNKDYLLEKDKLKQLYYDCSDLHQDDLIDNTITELPFAEELVHLTSLQDIIRKLSNKDMYKIIHDIMENNYNDDGVKVNGSKVVNEKEILDKISRKANEQITADGNSENMNVLCTAPINNLINKYSDEMPVTVIIGAKGAGKTFLYKQMLRNIDWKSFCAHLKQNEEKGVKEGNFIPVLASKNFKEWTVLLDACINEANLIEDANVSRSIYADNIQLINSKLNKQNDWFTFWNNLLVHSFNEKYTDMDQLNTFLEKINKRIVFIMDGLEESFTNTTNSEVQQQAIQVLCQDVVSNIVLKYPNIGLIVFMRHDLVQNSIKVNLEQFEQTYQKVSLRWSTEEALRLVAWIVEQAAPEYIQNDVSMDKASKEVIDDVLLRLWGKKLGKNTSNEAYTSNWILAALSDFNGQLQARDMIRFLRYATEAKVRSKAGAYSDRLIYPAEIRSAVEKCSKEKIKEVNQEYQEIGSIFKRWKMLPKEVKKIPLKKELLELNEQTEKSLIQAGFLKILDGKYYIPEIIRHALEFTYEKGARPKVLSLLSKK